MFSTWFGARSRLDDWHGPHVDGKCGRGISLVYNEDEDGAGDTAQVPKASTIF